MTQSEIERLAKRAESRIYCPNEDILAIDARFLGRSFSLYSSPEPFQRDGDVAIVDISGPLMQAGSYWFDSHEDIKDRALAAINSNAKALLLRVSSPGGVVAGMVESANEVRAAADAAGKPIVSLIAYQAASAAYNWARIGNEIIIQDSGEAGSIGVIATRVDATKQNDMMGLRVVVASSGTQKLDGNPDVPITEEEIARLKSAVEHFAGMFFAEVARSRNLSVADIKAMDGASYFGKDAIKQGLADKIGGLELAKSRALALTKTVARSSGKAASAARIVPKANTMNPTLLALLGLAIATAQEEDVISAVEALKQDKTKAEAKAAEEKARADALHAEIERVKKIRLDALVEEGERIGKITGANRKQIVSDLCGDDPDKLLIALQIKEVVARTHTIPREEQATTDTAPRYAGKTWDEMSTADKEDLYKRDPKEFSRLRKEAKSRASAA